MKISGHLHIPVNFFPEEGTLILFGQRAVLVVKIVRTVWKQKILSSFRESNFAVVQPVT
jgi:hypothetical protein